MPAFIRKRDDTVAEPCLAFDGAVDLDAAHAKPIVSGPTASGAPVTETSHEFVVKKKPASHAEH